MYVSAGDEMCRGQGQHLRAAVKQIVLNVYNGLIETTGLCFSKIKYCILYLLIVGLKELRSCLQKT